jgi:hypothetical protein
MKSVALFAVMPSSLIAGLVCPAHAAPCTALTFECLYPPFLGTEIPGVWQHVAPTSPAADHEAGHDFISHFLSPSGKQVTIVVKSPVTTKEYDVPPITPGQNVASYLSNALVDHGHPRNRTDIKFPRDIYTIHFAPYSNCNQGYDILPPTNGLADVVIDGQGSTVNFSAFCNGIGLINARRVVLRNFTFRWPGLKLASVGTVTAVTPPTSPENQGTYTVHVDPLGPRETPKLIAAAIGWDREGGHYDLLHPRETAYYGDGVTSGEPFQCTESTSQQKTLGCTVTLPNQNSGFKPGQAVVLRYYDYGSAIVIDGQDLTFDHLRLENLPGLGFNLQGGRGIRVTHAVLARMGNEPLSSGSNASAVFGPVSGDVVFDHNVFGYSGDDGFQINFNLAQYVVPPSTGNGSPFEPVEPSVANGLAWPENASQGDIFALYTKALRFEGVRKIDAVQTPIGGPTVTNPAILTLHKDVGQDLVANGFIGADLTQWAGARYLISDNVFEYTAGRALLLQTPFGLVTHNRFVGQSARQVYVMTSQYWAEGGGGQELTIADNFFDARGHGGDFLALDIAAEPVSPTLNIGPEVTNRNSAAPSVNENIIVANNSFVTDRVADVVNIASANNILFSGNRFFLRDSSSPRGSPDSGQYPVSAHDASNIEFDAANQFDPNWLGAASCAQSRLLQLTVPPPKLGLVKPAACAILPTTTNLKFDLPY